MVALTFYSIEQSVFFGKSRQHINTGDYYLLTNGELWNKVIMIDSQTDTAEEEVDLRQLFEYLSVCATVSFGKCKLVIVKYICAIIGATFMIYSVWRIGGLIN